MSGNKFCVLHLVFAGVIFLVGCGSRESGSGAAGPATAGAPGVELVEPAATEAVTTEPAATTTGPAEVVGSDSQPMTDLATDANGPVLTTEDFEQHRYELKGVKAAWLMPLLEDLKSRRTEDRAGHHGARGPNGDFLDGWIRKIAEELQRRGYAVDNEGNALNGG